MDVDRKREADWPHWPDRGNGPTRRDRLERRLFRDSELEAELERARAAVRQIEKAAAAKAAQIRRLERAMERVDGLAAPVPDGAEREPELEPVASTHLVFVGNAGGYSLCEAWGDVPPIGGRISVDGVEHVVAKLGRSPLPDDRRRCAYLEPV